MDPILIGLLASTVTSFVVNILQALRANVKTCKWWGGNIEFKNNNSPPQEPVAHSREVDYPPGTNVNITFPESDDYHHVKISTV